MRFDDIPTFVEVFDHIVAEIVDDVPVVGGAAGHDIGARSPVEKILPSATVEEVIPVLAIESIVVVATVEEVIPVLAIEPIVPCGGRSTMMWSERSLGDLRKVSSIRAVDVAMQPRAASDRRISLPITRDALRRL
jgi:hypothetical protein